MRAQRKFLPFLYLFLASLIPFFIFILLVDPSAKLGIFGTSLGTPLLFFLLLFASFLFLFTFVFASTRRGLLAAIFMTGIFVLRFFGLKSPFQTFILFVIILLVEFLYSRRTS